MLRLTPLRQKIWDLLCRHPQPLTAYQLVDLYEEKWQQSVHAMSVYRCLDYFIAQHKVVKIQSLNSYMLIPSTPVLTDAFSDQALAEFEHCCKSQLLICDDCHHVFPTTFSHALLQQLQQATRSFQLQLSGMEFHGRCSGCCQDPQKFRGKP